MTDQTHEQLDIDAEPYKSFASFELLKYQVLDRYSRDSDVAQLVSDFEEQIAALESRLGVANHEVKQ